MSKQKIVTGSVGISESSHAVLINLVFDVEHPMSDRPFSSIVEAFRFAFAVGFSKRQRIKRGKNTLGVAPRQFNVMDYHELVKHEAIENSESLGLIISEYAEAGVKIIQETIQSGNSVLDLILITSNS